MSLLTISRRGKRSTARLGRTDFSEGDVVVSPRSKRCNATLVMGPGGYRFADYWHVGLPLSALVVICGVLLILAAWTLRRV